MLGKRKSSNKSLSLKKQTGPQNQRHTKLKEICLWTEIQKYQKDQDHHPPYTQYTQKDKISLVHREITKIDKLPINSLSHKNLAVSIKTLYLSNNFITNLQNIIQFKNLENLSLASNNISQITNLRYLCALPKLAHLSLEGNSITKHNFYHSYAVGVAQNLKVLDQLAVSPHMRMECVRNWDVYEETMKDLLLNYMKLTYLFQFYKKQAVHRIIIEAAKRVERDWGGHETSIKNKIDFYEIQADNDFDVLPISFLIGIEQILYSDAIKLTQNGQSLITESGIRSKCPIQGVIGSMYALLQKQRHKINELRQRIMHKYQPYQEQEDNEFLPSQNQKPNQTQAEQVAQILQNAWSGLRKQNMYYEWKLLSKMLMKMKQYSNFHKFRSSKMRQVCHTVLSRVFVRKIKSCFDRIHLYGKAKVVNRLAIILKSKQIQVYRSVMETIINDENEENEEIRIESMKQKFGKRRLMRKVWQNWKNQMKAIRLARENQLLKGELQERREREFRFLNKIKLLEKLLTLTEGKLRAYEQNEQLSSVLGRQPQDLLHELQQEMNMKRLYRSPSPAQFRSPSPKAIRKNFNKENHQPNLIQQRKFNSSRKQISLNDRQLF